MRKPFIWTVMFSTYLQFPGLQVVLSEEILQPLLHVFKNIFHVNQWRMDTCLLCSGDILAWWLKQLEPLPCFLVAEHWEQKRTVYSLNPGLGISVISWYDNCGFCMGCISNAGRRDKVNLIQLGYANRSYYFSNNFKYIDFSKNKGMFFYEL